MNVKGRCARASVGIAACLLGASLTAATLTAQSSTYSAREEMVRARVSLEAGNFREAEKVYATALSNISPIDTRLRAGALFGHAFAVQQRLVAGDTLDDRIVVDGVVQEYVEAAELNPGALAVAAANNAGLVLRAVGRHERAKSQFLTAAGRPGPQQATLFFSAGREFESLAKPDSARWAYRRALAVDTASQEARRALLGLFARSFAPESTLSLASRWRSDSASARAASDALLALLTRENLPLARPEARKALILLCDSWPVFTAGPSYFAVAFNEPLQRAARLHPNLRDGVLSLADAYAPRRRDRLYVEPSSARWWHSERGPDGARATWSALLRSIGDSYSQRDENRIARSYYEAAIGWGSGELNSAWVDRRAFLPLALLYAEERREPDSETLQQNAAEFTERMFMAKGEAYRRGDLEQIHDFHLTLGALYAARKQWTGSGAQNAEFQLEHMRSASRSLERQTGRTIADPPDLLEKLAIRYLETGRPDKAAEVSRQIRQHYIRVQRPDAAAEAERRIERAKITTRIPEAAASAAAAGLLKQALAPAQPDSVQRDSTTKDSSVTDKAKRTIMQRVRLPLR